MCHMSAILSSEVFLHSINNIPSVKFHFFCLPFWEYFCGCYFSFFFISTHIESEHTLQNSFFLNRKDPIFKGLNLIYYKISRWKIRLKAGVKQQNKLTPFPLFFSNNFHHFFSIFPCLLSFLTKFSFCKLAWKWLLFRHLFKSGKLWTHLPITVKLTVFTTDRHKYRVFNFFFYCSFCLHISVSVSYIYISPS